jgi:plasmid stability protein
MAVKTTLELPDELMRCLKMRAVQSDRPLKDVVTELLERGLSEPDADAESASPVQALWDRLIFHEDGTVTNPNGIDDPEFFALLEQIREEDRQSPPRDPFAEH